MPNYGHGKYSKRNHIQKKHVIHRLANKTDFIENGCWLWTGSQDQRGYGQIRLETDMTPEKVHRIAAYFLLNYDGIGLVLHVRGCPNKHCWNPDHLYIGSYSENLEDRFAVERMGVKFYK